MARTRNDERDPEPLDRLVRVLATAEKLFAAGDRAEREAVREWVCDLAWAVGTDPVDLRAAAKLYGRNGIKYLRYDYASYSEVLYRDARNYYDCLHELMHGYAENKPSGDLSHYGRDEDIADQWGELLPELRKVAEPFPPGDLERIAELARRELDQGKEVSPPEAALYDASMAETDGVTEQSRLAHLARLAHYRTGDKGMHGEGARVTDVLTFHAGEPEDRFVTKIGGLPYRPAALPWPTHTNGEPLSFFAQICFADSDDLVSVPDEVLLIFATEPHSYMTGPQGQEPGLRFEWYPLGITNLVAVNAVPAMSWKLLPCYATCERVPEVDGPMEGAKIGGEPYAIQNEYTADGEFLAALGQLRLSATREQQQAGYEALRMADDGLLNLYGDVLECDFQSY